MLKSLQTILLLFWLTSVQGQVTSTLRDSILGKEIKIGQRVPPLVFHNVLNNELDTVAMEVFQGKAIIIGFWATWCASCVASIPKLISFQSQYRNELQIIGVSSENIETLNAFQKKLNATNTINYILCGEPSSENIANVDLYRYFPHRTIPHYVWIDKHGTLRAITDATPLTTDNIARFLSGEDPDLNIKDDYKGLREKGRESAQVLSMKTVLNGYDSVSLKNFKHLSLLTDVYPGVSARANTTFPETAFHNRRIQLINVNISTLYRLAYSNILQQEHFTFFPANRIELQLSDSIMVTSFTNTDKKHALYCYDLIIPEKNRNMLFSLMRQDLERYFGIKGSIMPREKEVYRLVVTDKQKITKGSTGNSSIEQGLFWLNVKNKTTDDITVVLNSINQGPSMPIFVNETNVDYPIDLEIESNLKDVQALNDELQKKGLGLIQSTGVIDILFLEDSIGR